MPRNWTLLFFIGLLQTNLAGTSLGLPHLYVHEGTTYEIIKTDGRSIEIRIKNLGEVALAPEDDAPPSILQFFWDKNQYFLEQTRHHALVSEVSTPLLLSESTQFSFFPTVFKTFRARASLVGDAWVKC